MLRFSEGEARNKINDVLFTVVQWVCGFEENKGYTPLNPLLIEGTLVGRFWLRGVQKQQGVVFGRILRVL